ncbi:MAG TPA: tetratricopeptide repeat protein, partial [Candidatus Methylomirabilis sp.]|nr:tetratricopeptide repeat protein [Candidatus Methylomirabilis sp.]
LWLQAAPPHAAYLLLPGQIAWINVHGSALFGIALPGLVLVANLLPVPRGEPGWGRLRLDRGRLRHLGATVVCLPIVSLLNPHGASMLLFPFRQNRMVRLTFFSEWREVWHLPGIDPTWWEVVIILGLVVVAFLAASVVLLSWEGRFDPVGWGVVLSMGSYAVLRLRTIPFFLLAILPLLALALVRVANHALSQDPSRLSRKLVPLGTLACLLVLGSSIVDQALLTSRFSHGFGLRPNFFPEGAVAFLERHNLNGRIFNTYHFGGYLIWRRWPANQVIIDGRYDAILFDEALLEAMIQAYRSPAALDQIAAAYGVEILLLNADPRDRMVHINQHPDWARVYWDPVAEVFVRRGGRYADLVGTHEYRLTRAEPDLSYLVAYRRDPKRWGRAQAELQRAVSDNPANGMAWLALAQEYRAAGPDKAEHRLEAITRASALMNRSPGLGRVYAERAEALLQLGRLDEAKTAAQMALRLQRDLLLPHSVLAAVAEHRSAWTEAQDHLGRILANLEPDDARVPGIRERLEEVGRKLHEVEAR